MRATKGSTRPLVSETLAVLSLVILFGILQGKENPVHPDMVDEGQKFFRLLPGDESDALGYRYPPPTRPIQVVKGGNGTDTTYFSAPVLLDTPITAKWNSKRAAIVFYKVEKKTKLTKSDSSSVDVLSDDVDGYVFMPSNDPRLYRRLFLGTFETDGSVAEIRSVFFANADHDPMKELVVLVRHAGTVHGSRCDSKYDPYFFDDVIPLNADSLAPISNLNSTFGTTFECYDRHGNLHPELVDSLARRIDAQPFRNAYEVKTRLKKMGY